MRTASLVLAPCLAFAVASPSARADAVDPPPASCPRGAAPRASHAGPHCAPTSCASAQECSGIWWDERDDHACTSAPIGLCVETRTGYARGGPFPYTLALAECDDQTDCPAGSRCELARRCVAPPLTRELVLALTSIMLVLAIAGVLIAVSSRRRKARLER